MSVLKWVKLDVASLGRYLTSNILYTYVKECLKINMLLYLIKNILLYNLIDLYIYDYQILDSLTINEFAGIRWLVPTFLSTFFGCYSHQGHITQLKEHCIIVIYLQNKK